MPVLGRDDFRWADYWWEARLELPEWHGNLARSYSYRQLAGGTEGSDGVVDVVFAAEDRDGSPLTDDELGLVRWFTDHHGAVAGAALAAMADAYPALRETYGYNEDELAEFAPVLRHPDDLRSLIGLHTVNVHDLSMAGEPYLGLEFVCTWDDEHGLGLMMHGTRVVDLGGADTAILRWVAQRDADQGSS